MCTQGLPAPVWDQTQTDPLPCARGLRQLNADMVPIESLYFVSGSKHLEPGKIQKSFMASYLSSNGHISIYFHNINLKL